ncbi:MAG: glycosyltransferase family 39 protein [Pirellulales bacterium]
MSKETNPHTLNHELLLSKAGQRWQLVAVALVVIFAAIVRMTAYSGYVGGDDRFYLTDAVKMSNGYFEPERHWQSRLMMVLPAAAIHRVISGSLIAIIALPFAWSILCVALTYSIGREIYGEHRTALLGCLFLAVFPLHMIMSTQYFPAMGITACTASAFLLFLQGEKRRSRVLYFLSGVLLGLAFMHRETAIFMLLPFFVHVAIQRRWTTGYTLAVIGFGGVVLIECVAFYILFDDPLYRIHLLTGIGTTAPSASYEQIRPGGRLFSPVVSLVTNQEYGLFWLFIVAAVFVLVRRRDRMSYSLLMWLILVGLYTLWGTTSLSGYRNLRPWPRYMAMVIIPAALLLARWLVLMQSKKILCIATIMIVTSSLFCVYVDNSRTYMSLGKQLVELKSTQPSNVWIVLGTTYADMYFANDMREIDGIKLLEGATVHTAHKIQPALEVVKADDAHIVPHLLLRGLDDESPVPEGATATVSIYRHRTDIARLLESTGQFGMKLAQKLSPIEGYCLYQLENNFGK